MKITTNGLVLKEVKLRESDRILTLMTPRHGILSVSARGSMRPNSKFFSACGLFSYSEWTLHEGKTMFSAVEAAPIEVFWGLRSSVEAVALAAYIAELLQIFSPAGEEADALLRLALNSLHVLSVGKHPPVRVKAVFELRSLTQSGYMPDLFTCTDCDVQTDGAVHFDVALGGFFCEACAMNRNLTYNLNAGAFAALRHIVLGRRQKLFAFRLGAAGMAQVAAVAEAFMLYHMDWPPKTLAFLKTLL